MEILTKLATTTYREKYLKLLNRINELESENEKLKVILSHEKNASQSLFNAIPDTILLLSKDGTYLDVLSENNNLLIRPANELIGNKISDFLEPELSNTCISIISSSIDEQEIKHMQYELVINGELKYFEGRCTPINDNECLFIIRDLTENVIKKQEIRKKDDWFKSIFNASRDGFVVEQNEKIIYVNEAFVKLYGYDHENELLGKSISVIQAPESDEMMRIFGQMRLLGEPVPSVYEAKGLCKNNEVIDIEITASVFEVNGEKFIIDINRNISERKNFERKLKEQNEQLQKINRELDRFVYSASHDLRAPLRSLLGLVNLFRIDNEIENHESYLQRMEKSINNLDKFIQDIINYSRNARLEIDYEMINLFDFINSILDDIQFETQKKIPIYANYDNDFQVVTDKSRLHIILSNLLSNAFRYSNYDEPNPFIKVSAYSDGTYTTISVQDNGIGIENHQLDKVFDMFYRAHDKKVGSGLGLYIVKETIEALGGTIEVKSEIGKGSEFLVKLKNIS